MKKVTRKAKEYYETSKITSGSNQHRNTTEEDKQKLKDYAKD